MIVQVTGDVSQGGVRLECGYFNSGLVVQESVNLGDVTQEPFTHLFMRQPSHITMHQVTILPFIVFY